MVHRGTVQWRHDAVFVALAYAISWTVWAPLVVAGPAPGRSYLHLLGALGPACAALAVSARTGTWRQLLAGLTWRGRGAWIAFGACAPIVVYAIAAIGLRVAGRPWPAVALFGASHEYPELPRVVYWMATIGFYGYGEEIGWRGLLLPRMQARMGRLRASVVVAAVWAGWHLPLFWFAAGMKAMGGPEVVGWMASMVTGSILMTWLWNRSRAGTSVVALFHGVLDVVMTAPGAPGITAAVGAVLTLAGIGLAVALWRLDRPQRLASPAPPRPSRPFF